MDRQSLLLLFIARHARTKRQIFNLFQLFEKEYYHDIFDQSMDVGDLPVFEEGDYGMWSKDLVEDLEILSAMGFIVSSKMATERIPQGFNVWEITELGSDVLDKEVIPLLTELQRASLEQLFEQFNERSKQ